MFPLTRSMTLPAPEPEATANTIVLGEHETTGPLPVGFEFERYGVQYDRFALSTDGFIRFDGRSHRAPGDPCLRLAIDGRHRLVGGRVAYEVRGSAPRRRLVISLAEPGMPRAELYLVVHERTGIVEVRDAGDQSLGDPTIRQLDMAQPSVPRANSARKIG
jgi:hypothetical protein